MLTFLKDSFRPLYHFLSNGNYREYHRLLNKYGSKKRFQKKDIRFLDYHVQVPDPVSFVYQFKEIFFEESYKFTPASDSPVIYDCGANIGLSCLYFKRLFPNCSIKAFEADPEIFTILKSNIEKNTSGNSVDLFNKAVWVNDGGVEFSQEGADGGSIVGNVSDRKIKIESVRLKDLLMTEKIDFLKIDIEGAEVDVLLDCDGSLENVQNIFVEYHSLNNHRQRFDLLLKTMTDNGFRYYIQSPYHLDSPFVHRSVHAGMDLQLNVYCYR